MPLQRHNLEDDTHTPGQCPVCAGPSQQISDCNGVEIWHCPTHGYYEVEGKHIAVEPISPAELDHAGVAEVRSNLQHSEDADVTRVYGLALLDRVDQLLDATARASLPGAIVVGALNNRELATVLAALRGWQDVLEAATKDGSELFPEHFADCEPLDLDEIDALCERLNGA